MNIVGILKLLMLPVSLFHDVPDDNIPTNVTDTYTLAVILARACGFPINTAGKRKSIEIRTAPTVPFKICQMAAAEKKARRTVTAAHMINTNK